MKNSRLTAFELLYDILKNDAYSNIALDKALRNINTKDKAFISSLVLGVIERKITLDYIIDNFLPSKPKPKVKILLYLGAYQLYFMDKVPSSAAINESVSLAGEVGCSYYKGLINAVLHKIDNNRVDLNTLDDLSVRYSCPPHLINMWRKMYGNDKVCQILSSINEKAPVFAVPNTQFVSAEELQYELLSEEIGCETDGTLVTITSSFDLHQCKAFQRGLFHIEDKSSYECAKALGAEAGETVFDICSAPGGKAFTIAENMKNIGSVYAFDLHEHRVKLIENGAKRLALDSITAQLNDAEIYNKSMPMADKILCDVPCSGFGIIRRKPEIRYKNLDSIKDLPEIQYRILSVSSKYLKSGGRMIYSTCTLNKKENEKVVEHFLEQNTDFNLVNMKTIFPSQDGGDGFFFAVMEKNNA